MSAPGVRWRVAGWVVQYVAWTSVLAITVAAWAYGSDRISAFRYAGF